MQLLREPEAFRRACDEARARGQRVGLVPTMGALHAGHVALIEEACRKSAFVAVSIFVNPTQFGPNEDYSRYPRPLEKDLAALEQAGVDAVFLPEPGMIYPAGYKTFVTVEDLGKKLCGLSRPNHFRGVATVVLKLFNLVQPDQAFF